MQLLYRFCVTLVLSHIPYISTFSFTKGVVRTSGLNSHLIQLPHANNAISSSPLINHHHHVANSRRLQLQMTSSSSSSSTSPKDPLPSYDTIIIGSGIGGLTCAALLSLYGQSVAVLESHYAPGGCAHGFRLRDKDLNGDFVFDTGPSFFSGLNPEHPPKASNPLRSVLDAIGEHVECIPYKTFGLKFPEGDFIHASDFGTGEDGVLQRVSGPDAVRQWSRLMTNMKPLKDAVDALPTLALRFDIGAILTAGPYLPQFAKLNPLDTMKLTSPFTSIVSSSITDEFAKHWLDLLCFCLSGLPADGTITAEMAMMMDEFYDPNAVMDCPKGGAVSIARALIRGIEKRGGHVICKAHVERIEVENGRVVGVVLKKKSTFVRAKKAVVSNVSVWDLFSSQKGLVDPSLFPESYLEERRNTPIGKSFMHLHVGFRMSREELSQLQAHYMYIDDWSRGVDAEDNAVLLSIPSVHDDTLAPDGYAVLHIYTPATEDFTKWERLQRNTPDYDALKEERSAYLWEVLERIIPDIRDRVRISRVGTPLTHKRFLRRHMGSYGPAIRAGKESFPFAKTPLEGLLTCGDSCFPGIGVPAVAGSGILAANSVSLESVGKQMELLKEMRMGKR